jgi:hypothetical protein
MAYADEFDRLSRALAALVEVRDGPLDEIGVQAALTARRSLLTLVESQLAEAAPIAPDLLRDDLQTLAQRPVAALRALLHRYPRPPAELSPLDLAGAPQATLTGRRWLDVARAADLAEVEWHAGGPDLSRDQLPVVIRDAAHLTKTVATLDADLRGRGDETGTTDLLAPLQRAPTAELALAAAQALATEPATDAPRPHRGRRPAPRPLPVQTMNDLVPALRRLQLLLAGTPALSYPHAQALAVTLGRVCLAVARSDPAGHADYEATARTLTQAANGPRDAALLAPPDPRPALQAGEIHRLIKRNLTIPAELVQDVAREAQASIRALTDTAQRHLRHADWVIRTPDETARLGWEPWHGIGPTPRLVGAARDSLKYQSAVKFQRPIEGAERNSSRASVCRRRQPTIAAGGTGAR